jgi:septal ring factor EnvC (AmiA/AmiB activator)
MGTLIYSQLEYLPMKLFFPVFRIVYVLLFVSVVFAQKNTSDISKMWEQIENIEGEINILEKEIRTADNKLKVETKSIENIDKQISLTHEKVDLYQGKINENKKTILKLKTEIDSLGDKIKVLQNIFKQQVVFAYKYQRGQQYDWLLGSESFNEIFIRYSYFKRVVKAEEIIYEELNQAQLTKQRKEDQLLSEIKSTEQLLTLTKEEEDKLNVRRKTKSQLITQITQNKSVLTISLNEKKESYRKLKNILASLDKGRSTRRFSVETQVRWEKLTGSFTKNRGKFNWPVQGELLHGFGRYKNPELKTVLNNPGIDIQALRGSNVRCIFSGVVSLITYMGGFGNTVIVDHNDGFYSVYAHLDQILVSSNEFIEDGFVIGTVGESGFLEGPQLHFEIYGNNKNLNPLEWLKKM